MHLMSIMEKVNYQAGNRIKRTSFFLSLVFIVQPLFLTGVEAQQVGSNVITYQESITSDEEDRSLVLPSFVYADPFTSEIYVIDGRGRIIIFSSEIFPLITLSGRDGIESPQGLTVDSAGALYIAQSISKNNPRNRISVYNACLKWERDIYLEDFEGKVPFAPYRLAIDKKGNLFVAASHFPGVLYIDTRGRIIDIISPEEEGKKVFVNNVFIDKTDRIYVLSEDESKVYVYDENRKFINKFGEKGGSTGKLSRPKAIGVDDRTGRIYVVDYMRHTITSYNKEGNYIFEFGGLGWGEGWFQHPIDVSVDGQGRIFVADLFNQRIQVFNSW